MCIRDSWEMRRDAEGRIFIDRDGNRFRHIINWLRNPGHVHVCESNPAKLRAAYCEILEESLFFGLEPLTDFLRNQLTKLAKRTGLTPMKNLMMEVFTPALRNIAHEDTSRAIMESPIRTESHHESATPRSFEFSHEFRLDESF